MSDDGFARVTTPEIALDVPDGWEDCSVARFLSPEHRTSLRLSTVASPDRDVRYHAFALQARMQRSSAGYRVVSRRFFRMSDKDAFELVFDWQDGGTPCRNFVRIIVDRGVLSLLTATAPIAALEKVGPAIAQALGSFALAP